MGFTLVLQLSVSFRFLIQTVKAEALNTTDLSTSDLCSVKRCLINEMSGLGQPLRGAGRLPPLTHSTLIRLIRPCWSNKPALTGFQMGP